MALNNFDDTLSLIYRAGMAPAQWPAALAAISDHVGASGALIANHNLERDEGLLITSRLSPDISNLYVERYGVNPYSIGIKSRPPGRPFAGAGIADRAAIRRTAFFADVFEPQRIVEHVMIGHRGMMKGADTGGVAMMLGERAADRIEDVLSRTGRLAPHICAALDLSLTVQRTRAGQQDIMVLLEALSTPALLLDRVGRVVHANRLAEALLAERSGLGMERDRTLTFRPASENQILHGLIFGAVAIAEGRNESAAPLAAKFQRKQGHGPLLASVTPLTPSPDESWPTARGTSATVLLRLTAPFRSAAPSDRTIALLLGLTPREAAVATMVGAGLTTPQIARELDLSLATVRTYLTRCFDKTGVRSQSALAHLLASLPHALP